MNLSELINQFKILSGRYDLVDENLPIVKTFINQGSRFLDRSTHHQKSVATHFTFLNVDDFRASFPQCRAVKEVWAVSTTKRWQLHVKPIQDILINYLSNNDYIESSAPLYYAPTLTRRIPEGADISGFTDYIKYLDAQTDVGHSYNAIVIVPPTDTKLMLDIRGLFYSKELINDNDENYWSVSHPLILLQAAIREMEIFNRKLGLENLDEINKDLIEEEISEINQMEG